MTTTTNTENALLVHRDNEEGALMIDRTTGLVIDPGNAPDWAAGLTCALVNEHRKYYADRTGPTYKVPNLINYTDLGWIGVNEEGNEVELEADSGVRMERLAELLGVSLEAEASNAKDLHAIVEIEIAMDTKRSNEEVTAFEFSQETGFAPLKTGTSGE